jgi:hypothetical protein
VPLTDAERERLRRSGLCWYCRTGQHKAIECPDRERAKGKGPAPK